MAIKSCNDINQRTRRGGDKRVTHDEVKKGEDSLKKDSLHFPFAAPSEPKCIFIRAAAEVEEKGGREQKGREQRKKGRVRVRECAREGAKTT